MVALAAAALVLPVAASAAELVVNGSFETNGGAGSSQLDGWTQWQAVGSKGGFFAQQGTLSPKAHMQVAAPAAGGFAAMSDQAGPSSHILYQDIAVPATGTVTLSLRWSVSNQADQFVSPTTLDYATTTPNQQARIDLMDPAAAELDVGSGVLQNLVHTQPGDAPRLSNQRVQLSLAAYAGRTVRLRIAQVDNLHGLNFAVDQVSVQTDAPPTTPAEQTYNAVPPSSFPGMPAGPVITTITGDAACRFGSATWLPSPLPASLPAGISFPGGLLQYTVTSCTPGAELTVQLNYPGPLPSGAQYWKYGPTADNTTPHWYVMPATFAGSTVTFMVKDGGVGDDDLLANGVVVDPGGVGVSGTVPPVATAATPVPGLSGAGLALLSLLTLVLANARRVRGVWRRNGVSGRV